MLQHPKALSSEWIDYFIISIWQMSFLNSSSDGCIFSFPISSLNRGQVWTFRISTRHITSARTAAAAVNTLFFKPFHPLISTLPSSSCYFRYMKLKLLSTLCICCCNLLIIIKPQSNSASKRSSQRTKAKVNKIGAEIQLFSYFIICVSAKNMPIGISDIGISRFPNDECVSEK